MTDLPPKSASASDGKPAAAVGMSGINPRLIDTVNVILEAFLGEAEMTVADLSALKEGSVLPLGASVNQDVELRLNGVPVARGELVAVGDRFAVRLLEISK